MTPYDAAPLWADVWLLSVVLFVLVAPVLSVWFCWRVVRSLSRIADALERSAEDAQSGYSADVGPDTAAMPHWSRGVANSQFGR